MTPVLFWTDAVVLFLLLLMVAVVSSLLRQPILRSQWRRVWQRPGAMAAGMLIMVFMAVGVLDTLHFRMDNGEVVSLLDQTLGKLKTQEEKTYSAPLAVRSFARESRSDGDGESVREFPRLRFGGAHLESVDERAGDLVRRFLLLALIGLSAFTLIALALSRSLSGKDKNWRLGLQRLRRGDSDWPLRTVLFMGTGLIVLLSLIPVVALDYHLLGTDKIGQDVLYQNLKSIRTGLVIGTLTTLVMLPLALIMGVAAGYFGGWVDDIIQYLYTTLNSIPGVLLIAAAVLSLQVFMHSHAEWFDSLEARADARLLALCLVLGVTSWTGLARLLRAETLKLRALDFVRSARALGVGPMRILRRHIVPNLMHIVLISVVLDFSVLVLAEAVLSYVGVGVDASTHSWGNMINSARLEMAREPMVWWSLAGAFTFMFSLVLAVNVFADAIRDVFDPRSRGLS